MKMKNSAQASATVVNRGMGFFTLLALLLSAAKLFAGYSIGWGTIIMVALIPAILWLGFMMIIGLILLVLWVLDQ